ncbi:hypothetical protein [Niallia oryzisoli]|uniref:hypothetical protein n=1 Tax=Niallia oryzisoli TaxID=1737571 RepID=UPI003736B09F
MWGIIWVIAAALIAVLLEKDHIRQSWKRKEKAVFFITLLFGTIVCIAWVLRIELGNPLEFIAEVYRPISDPLSSYIRQFKE